MTEAERELLVTIACLLSARAYPGGAVQKKLDEILARIADERSSNVALNPPPKD